MYDHSQDHTRHHPAILALENLRYLDLTLLSFPLPPPYPVRLGTVSSHSPQLYHTSHPCPCLTLPAHVPRIETLTHSLEPAPGRRPACDEGRTVALSWVLCSSEIVYSPRRLELLPSPAEVEAEAHSGEETCLR